MTLSNILSVVAILLTVLLVGWMKVLTARAFKSIDDKLQATDDKLKELSAAVVHVDASVQNVKEDIIRLKAFESGVDKDIKSVEKDVKHVKADVVRETQVMNNHLESVHKKIDHIDGIVEKLRDNRR